MLKAIAPKRSDRFATPFNKEGGEPVIDDQGRRVDKTNFHP